MSEAAFYLSRIAILFALMGITFGVLFYYANHIGAPPSSTPTPYVCWSQRHTFTPDHIVLRVCDDHGPQSGP